MRSVNQDMDRASAPVSAFAAEQSFWDHLGATRAQEYAQEDILGLCPEVVAPVLANPVPAAVDSLNAAPPTETDTASLGFSDSASVAQTQLRPELYGTAAAQLGDLRQRPPEPRKAVSAAQSRRARLSYRLQRIWLTPFYRGLITRGFPAFLVLGLAAILLANPQNRLQIADWGEALYSAVVDRPEFMVNSLQVSPVAPELERSIRARLAGELPQSSFRLDLPDLRAAIEAYDSVAEASLRLGAGGEMIVTIKERVPVVLWHSGAERQLLDIDGHRVAILAPNAQMPALPLIAGAGAQDHVREALALLDAAFPLGERLRGLVRVGERRWDVVLDRDQRIRLPEQGAMQALERALALDDAQDLLARDVLAVDLRNPSRPVLHVSPGAIETLRAIRLNPSEVSP
ncbi:MAG: cell division protein FtsQ/DivIB [Rhodobacteraceae bacterium]|nr:cell division protein FtsQ/DivIB [Paracoccaceae bacterium]